MTTTPASWRSRLVGHGTADPAALLASPLNARRHPERQRMALRGLLDEVGWVSGVLVSRQSGFIIDGHLRVELAVERGEAEIPVDYVDLSPDEEATALSLLDAVGAMAVVDPAVLMQALDQFQASTPAVSDAVAALRTQATAMPSVSGLFPPGGLLPHASPFGADGDVANSDVRVVQLYLDLASFPAFMAQEQDLRDRYGTDNVTDTVMAALAEAVEELAL